MELWPGALLVADTGRDASTRTRGSGETEGERESVGGGGEGRRLSDREGGAVMMETQEMETGTGLSYARRLDLLEWMGREDGLYGTGDLDSAELAGWPGAGWFVGVLAKRRPGLAYAKGGASTIGVVIELRSLGSRGGL